MMLTMHGPVNQDRKISAPINSFRNANLDEKKAPFYRFVSFL